MTRYVWLSFPLDPAGPRPPAIPAPELSVLYSVARDGASVHTLKLASHIGTHLDTPCHVVEGGAQITEFAAEELIFTRPKVIDLRLADETVVMPEHLAPHVETLRAADLALLRFGVGQVRLTDKARFSQKMPGLGTEAAGWLRAQVPQLRALGMDVPSLACIACLDRAMRAHNVLLEGEGRRFIVIEEMDLDKDLAGLREVWVSPWLVRGMDSGPCTILGVFA